MAPCHVTSLSFILKTTEYEEPFGKKKKKKAISYFADKRLLICSQLQLSPSWLVTRTAGFHLSEIPKQPIVWENPPPPPPPGFQPSPVQALCHLEGQSLVLISPPNTRSAQFWDRTQNQSLHKADCVMSLYR